MPKAGRRKRIKNPDDEDQWFDVPLVEKFRTEHGEGENRVVREFVFENVEPSNRLTRPRTVTHKARNVDGSPNPEDVDDESQRVVVELCEEFHTTHGRGEVFVKRIHQLETPERIDEPYTSRETHTSRIEGTEEGNTEDGWIDIERADKIVLRNYIAKETHELVWNDEEFNVTPDLPIDTDTPKDGYDPPWRLDPLQNVVNVKWKEDIVVLHWLYQTATVFSPTTPFTPESCSPVGHIPVGNQFIQSNSQISWALNPFFPPVEHPPGVSVSGEPEISPTSQIFGAWTVGLTRFKGESLAGPPASLSAIVEAQLGTTGFTCAGNVVGESGVRGMIVNNAFVNFFDVLIDLSGITATKDGITYIPFQASFGSTIFGGLSVSLTMHRAP